MSVVIPFPVVQPVAEPVPHGGACGPPIVRLHDAVAAARRRHRSLVVAAGRWRLAHGVPLPADHVALWAATVEQSGCYGDTAGLTGPWYAPELPWFVSATVGGWCAAAGCAVPADLPESLWYLYGFLADAGRLHPAGDPLADLRATLAIAGRLHHRPALRSPAPGPTAG